MYLLLLRAIVTVLPPCPYSRHNTEFILATVGNCMCDRIRVIIDDYAGCWPNDGVGKWGMTAVQYNREQTARHNDA